MGIYGLLTNVIFNLEAYKRGSKSSGKEVLDILNGIRIKVLNELSDARKILKNIKDEKDLYLYKSYLSKIRKLSKHLKNVYEITNEKSLDEININELLVNLYSAKDISKLLAPEEVKIKGKIVGPKEIDRIF